MTLINPQVSWVLGECDEPVTITWCRKPNQYVEGYTGNVLNCKELYKIKLRFHTYVVCTHVR